MSVEDGEWGGAALERLRAAAARFGSRDKLSQASGVPKPTLEKMLSGASEPKISTLAKVTLALGVALETILYGEQLSGAGGEQARRDSVGDSFQVPIYDITVSAGPGLELLHERPVGYMTFPLSELRALGTPGALGLVRLDGDSMAPELRDGELVMIDTSMRPREGLVCARLGNQLVLKRLRRVSSARAELVSVNDKEYPPLSVDIAADDFDVVGKAVWSGGRLF